MCFPLPGWFLNAIPGTVTIHVKQLILFPAGAAVQDAALAAAADLSSPVPFPSAADLLPAAPPDAWL